MSDRVVINLATGLEDAERATVAFLVACAALDKGKQVAMFLTKEAVRLGLTGQAEATACDGCPPLSKLFQQYADGGGELLVCPICLSARIECISRTVAPPVSVSGVRESETVMTAKPRWCGE